MAGRGNLLFIHGTWGNGPDTWAEMAPEMARRGYSVHTPTLRHHELPLLEGSVKIAVTSLLDYVDDLVQTAKGLDEPPLIFGVSLGGLLAQLVAARVPHRGLALFAPAPAWGMFNLYPGTLRMFLHHFLQWGFWRKPIFPEWSAFRSCAANEQTEETAFALFKTSCTESGRAYTEMAFWWADPGRASRVDLQAIDTPVIVFGGGRDRVVHPRIARVTAQRHKHGRYVHLPESDHLMIMGRELPNTLRYLDQWRDENDV
ncbi:MAG: alpha/beta fold hydrolase [Thermodesulfobacteriota bacterium]